MVDINRLLSNQNFGRTYRGSSQFRSLFGRFWNETVDPDIAEMRAKIHIQVNNDGKVVFRSNELDYSWTQNIGETPSEMMKRIAYGRGATDIFDPTKDFGLDGLMTSKVISGPQPFGARQNLGEVAQRLGLNIHMRTVVAQDDNLRRANKIVGQGKNAMGLVIADKDKIRIVEAYEKTSGRKLTEKEVYGAFGIDPNNPKMAKRIKAFLNGTQGSIGYGPGDLNVHVLNPENMFAGDNISRKRIRALAEIEKRSNPSLDVDERVKQITAADIDGVNFQSRTANKRMMGKLRAEVDEEEKLLNKSKGQISDVEMVARKKEIASKRAEITKMEKNVRDGVAVNTRIFGETSVGSFYGKGDLVLIEDDTAVSLYGRSIGATDMQMTRAEILDIDFFASENIAEGDFKMARGLPGRVTTSPVGIVGQVYSDIISAANMGDLYNPVGPDGSRLLESSLRSTLDEARKGILEGDISKLRGIAAQMEELDIDMFDEPQEYYDAVRNKDFIRKIEDFVDTGGRLESSPEMTRESMRIIGEHNFNQRRFDKTINFAGREVEDLKLRIPIPNSVKAHGQPIGVLGINPYVSAAKAADIEVSESIVARPGMSIVVPDFSASKRFMFSDGDIKTRLNTALGGPDWDDAFDVMYSYDPEAKRTLARLSRSPNALTEYAYVDVDLTLDKSYQKRFKDIYGKDGMSFRGRNMTLDQLGMYKKELDMKLEKFGTVNYSQLSVKKQKRIKTIIEQRDAANDRLHSFFANESGLQQTRLSQTYSMDKSIGMRRHYAPSGSQTTDASLSRYVAGSQVRGYSTTTGTIAERFAASQAEFNLLRAENPILPFDYINTEFNEIFGNSKGGASRLYADARQMPEYKALADSPKLPMDEINKAVVHAKGLLGTSVNTSTVIEDFIESTMRSGVLSPAQIEQFQSLVESVGKITRIEREKVIDEIGKTGDPRYIKLINEALEGNQRKLGQILGGMEGLGIDPAMLGQRLQSSQSLALIQEGYSKALGHAVTIEDMLEAIALSPDDPRSNVGRLYQFVLDEQESHAAKMADAVRASSQNLLDDIAGSGFQATDVESERARQFLKGFVDDQRAISGPLRDPEKIEQLLNLAMDESGPHLPGSDILGEFSEENLHRQSMNRLEGFGLLDDRVALDRQLVAIRQMAAERDLASEGMSLGRALSQVSERSPQASIHRLTAEAFNSQIYDAPARQAVLDFLEQTHRAPEFTPGGFIRYGIDNLLAENNLSLSTPEALSDLKSQVLATIEANKANMSDRAGREVSDLSRQIGQKMGLGDDATAAQIHNNVRAGGSIRAAVNNDVNPGQIHHAMRSMSDEAAAEVLDPSIYQQVSKRFDQAELGKLLSRPGFRKGLGAAAIFAGLGLLHEVRGGRSQAEMEGPAFSPDSNNYSGGMPSAPLQMPQTRFNSVNRGTTFAIRGRGNFDPYALGSQMSTITGASLSGTIYEGSNLQGMSRPRSSSEALNLRMGN